MDVHTRKLRYFLVMAEELHFSRAAARLFIAQQALSKQIRELEEAVEVELFRRTSRKVELTEAGKAFLESTRTVLGAFDDGIVSARRAARGGSGTLKVGFVIGGALELTAPILDEFRARFPDVELELHEAPFGEPVAGLGDGSSDVALIRLPTSMSDLEHLPLFVEPIVAALPSAHPLAHRPTVVVQELLNETIVVGHTNDLRWRDFWSLTQYRDAAHPGKIIGSASHTEELGLIAAGDGCTITVAAAARYTPYPGVRFVPIDGVQGSTVAVGWRRGGRTPLVDHFIDAARDVAAREAGIIADIEHPTAS